MYGANGGIISGRAIHIDPSTNCLFTTNPATGQLIWVIDPSTMQPMVNRALYIEPTSGCYYYRDSITQRPTWVLDPLTGQPFLSNVMLMATQAQTQIQPQAQAPAQAQPQEQNQPWAQAQVQPPAQAQAQEKPQLGVSDTQPLTLQLAEDESAAQEKTLSPAQQLQSKIPDVLQVPAVSEPPIQASQQLADQPAKTLIPEEDLAQKALDEEIASQEDLFQDDPIQETASPEDASQAVLAQESDSPEGSFQKDSDQENTTEEGDSEEDAAQEGDSQIALAQEDAPQTALTQDVDQDVDSPLTSAQEDADQDADSPLACAQENAGQEDEFLTTPAQEDDFLMTPAQEDDSLTALVQEDADQEEISQEPLSPEILSQKATSQQSYSQDTPTEQFASMLPIKPTEAPVDKLGAPTSAMAIAALAVGILALVFDAVPFVSIGAIVLGVVGLVLAGIGFSATSADKKSGRRFAIVGIALSIAAIVISLLLNFVFASALTNMAGNGILPISGITRGSAASQTNSEGSPNAGNGGLPVGTSATLNDGLVVTVDAIEFGVEDPDGHSYTRVDVRYQNTGTSNASINVLNWAAADEMGTINAMAIGLDEGDLLKSASIAPGDVLAGAIYFDGDITTVYYYSKTYFASDSNAFDASWIA